MQREALPMSDTSISLEGEETEPERARKGGMARERSPIFKRALEFIAFSRISTITSGSKLFRFKKKSKRFRLLKHYNYAFIKEYEFSPSSTPLFPQPRNPSRKIRCRRLMSCLLCGGGSRGSDAERWIDDDEQEMEIATGVFEEVRRESPELSDRSEEEDSIDRRAEKFIERFHQQMRMQRQESDVG